MKKILATATLIAALAAPAHAQVAGVDAAAPFDAETGIRVPAGFKSTVFADEVGRARHMAVSESGWVYVALRRAVDGFGAVALKDTDGDGKADVRELFAEGVTGTGMGIDGGKLYYGTNTSILRWDLPAEGAPAGEAEVVVSGMEDRSQHSDKPFTFDGSGHIYVNVGAPSNACMEKMRTKGSPGMDPCPILEDFGGIWRFDLSKTGQTQADGVRYATGVRNAMALDWNMVVDSLYLAQHGRDQLQSFFPDLYDAEASAELPAEEFHRVLEGANIGWPYGYVDQNVDGRVLMPEYGGDGKQTTDRGQMPLIAFPGHWAPNDLIFVKGGGLPMGYKNGALIAFHGSWNRAPMPQAGYRVVFVPMDEAGNVAGDWVTFADGFPSIEVVKSPRDAKHRPTGLAEGPDGAIYISSLMSGGRIYRVTYEGK
ncbi:MULTISPECIES: PQQ-dependent sugar dehydrogenase [Kordiimonas]|uniref:PQQ-dependent sugar dehydrogenase n=1 Tax=Kordiimonas TaxID=288021 RepID=UPI00257A6486|nr:PQQ-dependent sugar dehydrogenase [Kordiimonas sp. UBA4487]